MSLTRPQNFNWPIGPPEPFILNETSPYQRNSLRAADGHAIPFPLRLLNSERYWRGENCRGVLMIENGIGPRYPGVNYVMEIHISGNRRTLGERARQFITSQVEDAVMDVEAAGPVGGAVLGQMRDPSPLAGEQHWTARVVLLDSCSAQQVTETRVAISCSLYYATIRYDVTLPMQ